LLLSDLNLLLAEAVFCGFLVFLSVFHFHIFADWRRKANWTWATKCVVPCLFWSRRRRQNAIHTRRKRIGETRDRERERERESSYVRRRKRKHHRNGTFNTGHLRL